VSERYYGEIPKVRGVVLHVALSDFRGARVDVREHVEFRPGDPDTRRPTQKGVSLTVDRLPELLALLHQVERDALASGLLKPRHYERSGLTPPELEQADAAGT
jgi:hypothetical protein